MSTIAADVARIGYSVVPLQLAYHESAHALIAARCGRAVSSLTVSQHGGLTRSEGPSSPEIGLLVAIAGDRGERLVPGCVPELIGFGHNQDQQDAELALDLIGRDAVHRDFVAEDARRQVDDVLAAERDRLDYVARLLLKRQRLDGHELTQWLT